MWWAGVWAVVFFTAGLCFAFILRAIARRPMMVNCAACGNMLLRSETAVDYVGTEEIFARCELCGAANRITRMEPPVRRLGMTRLKKVRK